MSKTQVVGTMSEWSGIIRDMFRQFDDGSLTLAHAKAFTEHRNPFAISDIQSEWQEFYRKYFRISVDFSDVSIPADPGGFDRVIFIPKGLKLNDVLRAIRKQFPAWSYEEDLDKDVIENIRKSDRNYAILIRERVEADEELKNISANQLKQQGVNAITLLERLVLELKYWSETGQHLDVSNITLCAGSRSRFGSVPNVDWSADCGKLHIYWFSTGRANGRLRARQSVS
ncbi:MAG: hypothetical protein PHO91_01520 [Patescibacteria group bacterium]|nr:hypothetical protein [Patescibacteria group bacterium]